ncbi:MAG: hypothetical protein M3322_05715 [Actinomycetota bacterium]|nr:hypothetical protein [Actinomycetota bacterium]
MSTSPDNRIVALLSRWLARHIGDDELRSGLGAIRTDGLTRTGADLVGELEVELGNPSRRRGQLEVLARETLEEIAHG